ncbi:MAG TPA: sigma 54-interacting transcriptional regulator, partial [Cyclobacteriaceae bacterium]|nr:sigma 54-interacting transcriptional regulator [Cyclobacteriaceae bacterium]
DPKTMIESSNFMADNPGIYQGEDLAALKEQFPMFAMAGKEFNINSAMVLSFKAQNTTCLLVLGNSATQSFQEDQFNLIQLLLPQIILAFSNLLNYESLREQEAVRSLQLQVNNILMGHTNREDFALALAEVINKTVPCERFVVRTWAGDVNLGYRIPLKRKEDGTFERFSEWPMVEHSEQNPQDMIKGSTFMVDKPGIYQGDDHKKLREQFPLFALGAKMFEVYSSMVFTMKVDNKTCLMILGNKAEVSFNQSQYEQIQTLVPQITLAFENLFKYEKLKEEERERNTQLGIMTAFNSQGELEEMALEAIARINDFIPFEYWLFVSDIPALGPKSVRLATKSERRFYDIFGEELLKKIDYPGLVASEFVQRNRPLFEKPKVWVDEEFDKLQKAEPYYAAIHKNLSVKSLVTIPVSAFGKYESMIMMGSTRRYAFSEEDLQAVVRILPYLSMIHQQYHAMEKIQNLTKQLEMEKDYLVEEIKSNYNFEEIIGTHHVMKDVFRQISQVSNTDSTVLVLGETGTGKELIARAIHNQSPRKDKVLIKVNCASLPAQLIESELFGHEKGSFTGALEKRIGKFELANGGTIFLDEMGELPLELQAKLLRVLQEKEIERIGGKQTIPLDVRIIAATNRDLETEVAEGRFRSDLFYRLNVFPIHLPPLRERSEDIPMLITHFFQKYSKKMKRPIRSIKDEVLQEMIHYEWPGNIRELENVIEQAVIVGDSNSIKLRRPVRKNGGHTGKKVPNTQATQSTETFQEEEIYRVLKMTKGKITGPEGAAAILDMRPAKIEEFERRWILDALQKTAGRIRGENGAAELIGIKPTTLEARVKKLKIGKAEIFK